MSIKGSRSDVEKEKKKKEWSIQFSGNKNRVDNTFLASFAEK